MGLNCCNALVRRNVEVTVYRENKTNGIAGVILFTLIAIMNIADKY